MLQYPLALPPLSLRSKDNPSGRGHSDVDRRRNLSTKRVKNDNVLSGRPAFAAFSHPHALPVSTIPFKPPPTVSPTFPYPSLPPPSPNFAHSRYLSSAKQVPSSPGPRPHTIDIPSFPYSPRSSRPSTAISTVADILFPGELIGEGLSLQGEEVRLVPFSSTPSHIDGIDYEEPAKEFEVVRLLGTGSYAVVYHVREVLSRTSLSEDDHSPLGRMDLDDRSIRSSVEYGREYAIKCLSKANLDEEALEAQTFEATIHQSLPAHSNIVTLYRTLETSSLLLLLLEYVPGEDLFYFLEQARDHYEMDPSSESSCTSRTPPTPSLLSSLDPDQLLSHTRLRLIASMFSQMCEAVATCHNSNVFHRDIKPENFIVTDGWTTSANGEQERKVVVKLSDFGLSTHDIESADMDCGSAPYMSYECRNNVAATYSPRAADVWSLGIVLINMLYHYNPWTDTAQGVCSSFELFRQQPVNFFMQRFTGMSQPVAHFLATKVFCIIGDSKDDTPRITAEEFGAWAKDLPSHFAVSGHARVASTQGHPISSGFPQSRPGSRQASLNLAPRRGSRSISRVPSFFDVQLADLPTVLDQDNEGQEDELESDSRSPSTQKRRKRGARKGKGGKEQIPTSPVERADFTSHTLAKASQTLARELSRTSRSSLKSPGDVADLDVPPLPIADQQLAVVSKKSSKWKLSFGKSSGERSAPSPCPDEPSSPDGRQMSATASNVTNLIMGLNPPQYQSPPVTPKEHYEESSYARGRRAKGQHSNYSNGPYIERWANNVDNRGTSPTSIRSGRPLASSASSMASDNWRSQSSAATSTSAFTRFSNGSVSTIATSVSSSSWRKPNKPAIAPGGGRHHYVQAEISPNAKFTTGVAWEVNELPRVMHPDFSGDTCGSPPGMRKQRSRKPKESKLDTISERPGLPLKPQRLDASTSTTDLNGTSRDGDFEGTPKKVQKGQINALAKMLSALRR
jgi:serine/threonine protein kinase